MFSNAVLSIENSDQEYIGIPVLNFPILPIGSEVTFMLDEDLEVAFSTITAYRASATDGIEIEIELLGATTYHKNKESRTGEEDELWKRIAAVCTKDTRFDYIYPRPIDFSTKLYLPSPKT